MKIKQVLQLLTEHNVIVHEDLTHPNGLRTIIVGTPLPSIPYGTGKFVYTTIVLSHGQDELSLEEREAVKRRLHHLTTDIFGDDPEVCGLLDDDADHGSHLHPLVPRKL